MRKTLDPHYLIGAQSLANGVSERIRASNRIEISSATALLVFELFLSEMKLALYDGAQINIRDFGQLVPRDPASRIVPKYGLRKPKRTVKFLPAPEVLRRLNEED